MDNVIILLLSALVALAQHIAAPTYQSPFCGLGALVRLPDRKQPAPMAYRVLAYPFRKYYHLFKFVTIVPALYAVGGAFGFGAVVVTAFALTVTFWYDYWDWAVELAGVYFAIAGNFPAAMVYAVLWGASRETAPLIGLAYWLAGGDVIGAAALSICASCTIYAVRYAQGKRPLYCARTMLGANGALLANCKPRAWLSVMLILLCTSGIIAAGKLYGIIPLALILAGVIMGKLDEARLFSAAVPFLLFLL